MFYIRVDGNEIIATGHIMRCLSIAGELKNRGEDVTFIIADSRPQNLIIEHGFSALCLDSAWDDMDQEIEKMISLIKEHKISFLLIDSYFVTKKYLEKLKQYTKIAYIDDINSFIYPVDYLINYNMYAKSLRYQERYHKAGLETEFLLGCLYAPLRNEFSLVKRKTRKRFSKVLLTTGGTDNYNVAGHVLEELRKHNLFNSLEFEVIVGRFNKNKACLMEQWENYPNVHLRADVSNMAEYMKECDASITAGGVTTYELCACGLPSIMFTLADNQLEIAQTVSSNGLMPWVGDVREDMGKCINKIIECLMFYKHNYENRMYISKKMQDYVDGLGCRRLADFIMEKQIY